MTAKALLIVAVAALAISACSKKTTPLGDAVRLTQQPRVEGRQPIGLGWLRNDLQLSAGHLWLDGDDGNPERPAMSLDLYLGFVAATLVLILIPGPNVALIVANSVAHNAPCDVYIANTYDVE